MIDVEAACLHSHPADLADPAYWIDWAVDNLAYSVLGDARWPDEVPPRCLEAVAEHFRERLARSRGLVRFIELSADPLEIEQALEAGAEAFLHRHYPEIKLGHDRPPRKVELQELARCEAAADVLWIAADIIAPMSREASALLLRCAQKEQDSADTERERLQTRKRSPANDIVAAVEFHLGTHAPPDVRCDIASDLVGCLLDETMPPREVAAHTERCSLK